MVTAVDTLVDHEKSIRQLYIEIDKLKSTNDVLKEIIKDLQIKVEFLETKL